MASTSPVRTSITMPQAPMALELLHRLATARRAPPPARAHRCDSRSGVGLLVQPLLEEALHAGDAVAVDIDAAQHLGGDAAERIAAPLGRLEVDARNAERVDRQLLPRGDLAGEVDELLARSASRCAAAASSSCGSTCFSLWAASAGSIISRGLANSAGGGQRDRQDLAVAVGDHGAAWRCSSGSRGRVAAVRSAARRHAPVLRCSFGSFGSMMVASASLTDQRQEQHGEAGRPRAPAGRASSPARRGAAGRAR